MNLSLLFLRAADPVMATVTQMGLGAVCALLGQAYCLSERKID